MHPMLGFTSELTSTITSAKTATDNFCDARLTALKKLERETGQGVEHAQERIIAARGEVERVKSLGARGAAANIKFSNEQQQATEERDELRKRADEELPLEVDELKSIAATAESSLVDARMNLNTAQTSHSEKLTSLQDGVDHYASTGLTFDRAGDNKLKLVFSQIDPTDTMREFGFTLNVNEMNKYVGRVSDSDEQRKWLFNLLAALAMHPYRVALKRSALL